MAETEGTLLRLSDGSEVRVDAPLLPHFRDRKWEAVAGRIIEVREPDFSAIADLATEIGGVGCFAADPADYRLSKLKRTVVDNGEVKVTPCTPEEVG